MENRDAELLIKVLDEKELEIVKDAYNLTITLKDQKLKNLLLRRINDVVSMARYIDICADTCYQNALEHLFDRMRNLNIAVKDIKEPSTAKSTFNYLSDNMGTPLIMTTIETMEYDLHEEAADLLSSLACGEIKEEIIVEPLKRISGNAISIIFARKGKEILIYDIDRSYTKKANEENIPKIISQCEEYFSNKYSKIIQQIFDDTVYEAIHYQRPSEEKCYTLTKGRYEES